MSDQHETLTTAAGTVLHILPSRPLHWKFTGYAIEYRKEYYPTLEEARAAAVAMYDEEEEGFFTASFPCVGGGVSRPRVIIRSARPNPTNAVNPTDHGDIVEEIETAAARERRIEGQRERRSYAEAWSNRAMRDAMEGDGIREYEN